MYNWARWVTDASPYEANGELKSFWANVITGYIGGGQPLTGEIMMDVIREKEAHEAVLVKALSSLRIGSKRLHIATTSEK